MLIFDAIERLEIAFRTQMIYQPAMSGGAWWFEDKGNFEDKYLLSEHLKKLEDEIARSSEVFIEHFRSKYDEENTPPIEAYYMY